MTFNTANGLAPTTEQAHIKVKELTQAVQAYLMARSPSVLSMGMRCMEQAFSFIWANRRTPYLFWQNKTIIRLRVSGNIPYLVPGDPILPAHGPR